MRNLLSHLLIALCNLSASSVLAGNLHESQLQDAITEMETELLYTVEFPQCVLDFQSLAQKLDSSETLNIATYSLNLVDGYFRGKWWLDFKKGSQFGEGFYRIDILCGSGLASMTAFPQYRNVGPGADKGTLFHSTPNITNPEGGLNFGD